MPVPPGTRGRAAGGGAR